MTESADRSLPPPGVWVPAAFFAVSGLLDCALTVLGPEEADFDAVWRAMGRGLASGLLALGLWHRRALCRSVALVYCMASVLTYTTVLALALTRQPLRFPVSVVVGSAFEIPSCVLLYFYLRSSRAARYYTAPLF